MERAQLAAQIAEFERSLFSRHLEPVQTASRKLAPDLGRPDDTAFRAKISADVRVQELETRLAPYGIPPRAPTIELADVRSLERDIRHDLVRDIPLFNISRRRDASLKARSRAAEEHAATLERQREERNRLQAELDAVATELASARQQVEAGCDEWCRQETARLERLRAQQQAAYDDEWQRLDGCDPPTVVHVLRQAFADEAVTALGALGAAALIVVACPAREEIIASQEPAVTSTGRLTVRKRSQTQMNDLYAAAVGSRILGAAKRALAAAPMLDAVACVAVRRGAAIQHDWEAIYLAVFERER